MGVVGPFVRSFVSWLVMVVVSSGDSIKLGFATDRSMAIGDANIVVLYAIFTTLLLGHRTPSCSANLLQQKFIYGHL